MAQKAKPNREEKIKWIYIGFPDFLVNSIDEAVNGDRYPQGR